MRRVYCWLCGRLTDPDVAGLCQNGEEYPICVRCADRLVMRLIAGHEVREMRHREWWRRSLSS